MRYRRSKRICKGIKINFSKSGISTTIGGKGVSINIGSKGTYLNTGIPGTGFYDRKKVSGGNSSAVRSNTIVLPSSVNVRVEDDGSTIIMDTQNNVITDEAILRKIKRTDSYKELRANLMSQLKNEIEAETKKIVEIYKLSSQVSSYSDYKKILEGLKVEKYKKEDFSQVEPQKEMIRIEIMQEAKKNVKTIALWKIRKMRQEYIQQELEKRFNEEHKKWELAKSEFEQKENKREEELNTKYYSEYLKRQENLKMALEGESKYVEKAISDWLSTLELPLDFNLQYEYRKEQSCLMLDLDLPEIENLPTEKATQLSSGQVKRKNKTQKELKYDYMQCVYGLAIFFASYFFDMSPAIHKILASGYTQRRDKKTGDIKDDYIYSIKFDRAEFEGTDFENIELFEFWNRFENRCLPTQTYELKTIEPYDSL